MNLHAIVAPAIAAINPFVTITIQASSGASVTTPDGRRTPAYAAPVQRSAQVQALTVRDLQLLDGLNIQGSTQKLYINGDLEGVIRADGRGGDLVTMPSGKIFLVTAVIERWPDWRAVSVTEQNNK